MAFLGLGKNKKTVREIRRLINILEKNPEDTKIRLTLANLYLENGDEETAISEYHAAAQQLSAEGLDLEPIAIYRKILNLDSTSLAEKSFVSIQKAERLVLIAKRTYEDILGLRSTGEVALDDSAPENGLRVEETLTGDLRDSTISQPGICESPEEQSPNQEDTSSSTASARVPEDSTSEDGEQETSRLPDITVKEEPVVDLTREPRIDAALHSSRPGEDLQIDLKAAQMDDDFEAMLSDTETETFIDDPPSPHASKDSDSPDPCVPGSGSHDAAPPEDSPQLDSSETPGDSDLPYNLGIGYYEMDLTDKAISEFVKAHNQGIKPVESLSMLAKCYCKKGLLHNAAGFIIQALNFGNLKQQQIDSLQGQLDEIRATIKSTGSLSS
jgi:tetratricopeptide (TPR) repeat protein